MQCRKFFTFDMAILTQSIIGPIVVMVRFYAKVGRWPIIVSYGTAFVV
jgi:hypothetical protein